MLSHNIKFFITVFFIGLMAPKNEWYGFVSKLFENNNSQEKYQVLLLDSKLDRNPWKQ